MRSCYTEKDPSPPVNKDPSPNIIPLNTSSEDSDESENSCEKVCNLSIITDITDIAGEHINAIKSVCLVGLENVDVITMNTSSPGKRKRWN